MPAKSPARPEKADENVLYVVLHGLITLIDTGRKGFIAHVLEAPEIRKRHKFFLGDWLSEIDIPERKKKKKPQHLVLQGVDSGNATLNADMNAVAKIRSIPSPMKSSVRAIIRLGQPRKIYSFVKGKLKPDGLQGTLNQLVNPKPTFLSGTQVFKYTYKKKNKVMVVDNSGKEIWIPKTEARVKTKSKLLNVIVLHVYNEPAVGMSKVQGNDHNRHEFKVSADFCKFKLDLAKPTSTVPDTSIDDLPGGLLLAEVLNLHRRGSAVNEIIRPVREGQKGPINRDAGGGAGGPVCGGIHAQITPTTQARR